MFWGFVFIRRSRVCYYYWCRRVLGFRGYFGFCYVLGLVCLLFFGIFVKMLLNFFLVILYVI